MQYIGAFSRIIYIYFLCFVPSYEVKLIFLPRVWLTFTESGSKIGFGKIQWFLRFIYCRNTLVSTYFYIKKCYRQGFLRDVKLVSIFWQISSISAPPTTHGGKNLCLLQTFIYLYLNHNILCSFFHVISFV